MIEQIDLWSPKAIAKVVLGRRLSLFIGLRKTSAQSIRRAAQLFGDLLLGAEITCEERYLSDRLFGQLIRAGRGSD
jgi:hypothetical protein